MRFILACWLASALVLPGVALAAEKPVPLTAWGKPVNGLQAGLRFKSGVLTPGAAAELEVVVRNVGQEKVKFRYTPAMYFCGENKESIVSAKAEFAYGGYFPPGAYLQPELTVGEVYPVAKMAIHRAGDEDKGGLLKRTLLRPGTYRVGMDRIELGLGKDETVELGTGYLDVDVPSEKR